jgi:hypothetical protein
VQPTGDIEDDDYVTPICLAEWGRSFYSQCLTTPGFVECETGPGEVMYVPRGWWHMVLNVAPLTVAVSHHFLSPAGLHTTLKLLRDKPHQVSGINRGLARDKAADKTAANETAVAEEDSDHARRSAAGTALLNRLMVALREKRPEALADAEARLQEEARRADERLQEELRRSKKKSAWRALIAEGGPGGSTDDKEAEAAAAPTASFSFGFG